MISFEDSDFRPLDELPIKWRWTDSRWNILPKEALKTIKPLVETKASELCQYSLPFFDQSGFNESLFENIKQVDAAEETLEIQQWLLGCSSNLNQTVIVSWDKKMAVLVQWKVFCEFWDDFCYPASDDVAIFPYSEEWMLFYQHEESFIFGKRRENSI
jgi:hypothetical protein